MGALGVILYITVNNFCHIRRLLPGLNQYYAGNKHTHMVGSEDWLKSELPKLCLCNDRLICQTPYLMILDPTIGLQWAKWDETVLVMTMPCRLDQTDNLQSNMDLL